MNAAVSGFTNRRHAGRMLAAALGRYANREDVIVLGLPRGGVPVAYEVARGLQAPLDVIVVRKLGVPGWEELAMGAISCGGARVLNQELIRRAGITPAQIEAVTARELNELHRREIAFRGRSGPPDVAGKTVLIIDDGIATGSTIQAAVNVLRQHGPAAIVIAVPTTSAGAFQMLKPEVEDFVALMIPADFQAVGQWYDDFAQTTDAEVKALLDAAASHPLETVEYL